MEGGGNSGQWVSCSAVSSIRGVTLIEGVFKLDGFESLLTIEEVYTLLHIILLGQYLTHLLIYGLMFLSLLI